MVQAPLSRRVKSAWSTGHPVRRPLLILFLALAFGLCLAPPAFANGGLRAAMNAKLASMVPPGSSDASLTSLFIPNDPTITDLDELAGATNLMYLTVGGRVNDISGLKDLVGPVVLDLSYNNFDPLAPPLDLSPLWGHTALMNLQLEYDNVSSVAPLASCTGLTWLYLDGDNLTDIGALTALHQLQILQVTDNYLDLSPGSQDMNNIQAIQANNPWSNGGVFSYTPQRTQPAPYPVDMVIPGSLVALHFDGVSSEGVTTAIPHSSGNPPPPNLEILGGACYNITTTAVFSGDVYVTIPYDDTGLTLEQEQDLTLQHSNGSGWDDITVQPVDTTNNRITGKTTSFSDFAVMASALEAPGTQMTVDPIASPVAPGDDVTATFYERNSGTVTLASPWAEIFVDGVSVGTVPLPPVLGVGDTAFFTYTMTGVTTGHHTITAVGHATDLVTGKDITYPEYPERAEVGFDVQTPSANPRIALNKVTVDAGVSGDGIFILSGEPILWRYTVTNPGDVPLSNVYVTDDQGVTPVYVSGDTDGDGLLEPTETWVFEASGTSVDAVYANTGTAYGTGRWRDGRPPPTPRATPAATRRSPSTR